MGLEPGQIVEQKYRIVRLLGEGGMGAVYECENTAIKKRFAIKVLHAAVARNHEAVSRFEKEAQAAGRIGSDHITEVVDLGTLPAGDRFMVMEFLDGEALCDRIRSRGRLTPGELAPLALQLLEGLGAAHEAGIIHRDLKPDNVFLLRQKAGLRDFVKILDFGISKFSSLDGSPMSLTRTGVIMGTPRYMSPEQIRGSRDLDARSDLYSVGVILFQTVTGQLPFQAESLNGLIFQIVFEPSPRPEALVPGLDPGFSAIIEKAMAHEPEQRFQSAAEFQAAIVRWMEQSGHRFEAVPLPAVTRLSLAAAHEIGGPRAPSALDALPDSAATGAVTGQTLTLAPPSSSRLPLLVSLAVVTLLGGALFAFRRPAERPRLTGLAADASAPGLSSVAPAPTTVTVVPPVVSVKVPVASERPDEKSSPGASRAGPAAPARPPPVSSAGGRKIRTSL